MHQLPKRRPGRMLLGMGAGIFAVSLLGSPALATTSAQAASAAATQAGGMATAIATKKASTRAARVIALARDYSRRPYRAGAAGPKSFDGPGYTRFIFGRVGVRLPRQPAQQAAYGKKIAKREARPGDLIVFTNGATSHHVAIYAGGGYMYAADGRKTGKRRISSDSYVVRRLI